MRGLALLFTFHLGHEHPRGDRWFSADKARHFFVAAFAQSASFSVLRTTGLSRPESLDGASVLTAGVSIGKEVYDKRSGGTPSAKDLTWDAAGMVAASALLNRTER